MAVKKQGGLGKGLEALFGGSAIEEIQKVSTENASNIDAMANEESDDRDKVRYLKLIDVEPNRSQPRRNFDEESMQELADSIKLYGVIQPIVVNYKENYYEIVAGERRWRAAKMAGLKEIPAVIKNIDERKSKEIALIENVQREDLNAIEKARGLKVLMEDYNLTQEELAAALGKSRSGIANSLRILNLDERIIKLAEDNKIKNVLIMVPSIPIKEDWEKRVEIFNGKLDIEIKYYNTVFLEKNSLPKDYYDYIVFDEAHHAQAANCKKSLQYFTPKYLIGLTATPDRLDRRKLDEIFGQYETKLTLREAIEKGVISNIRCYRLISNIDLSEVRYNGKDYNYADLEKALVIDSRNELITNTIKNISHHKKIFINKE